MLIVEVTPSIKYFSNHTGLFYYFRETSTMGITIGFFFEQLTYIWESRIHLTLCLQIVGKKKELQSQEKDIRGFGDAM